MRPRMTAADIEAERLRMQEQWKKQGGNARSAAEVRTWSSRGLSRLVA